MWHDAHNNSAGLGSRAESAFGAISQDGAFGDRLPAVKATVYLTCCCSVVVTRLRAVGFCGQDAIDRLYRLRSTL